MVLTSLNYSGIKRIKSNINTKSNFLKIVRIKILNVNNFLITSDSNTKKYKNIEHDFR